VALLWTAPTFALASVVKLLQVYPDVVAESESGEGAILACWRLSPAARLGIFMGHIWHFNLL